MIRKPAAAFAAAAALLLAPALAHATAVVRVEFVRAVPSGFQWGATANQPYELDAPPQTLTVTGQTQGSAQATGPAPAFGPSGAPVYTGFAHVQALSGAAQCAWGVSPQPWSAGGVRVEPGHDRWLAVASGQTVSCVEDTAAPSSLPDTAAGDLAAIHSAASSLVSGQTTGNASAATTATNTGQTASNTATTAANTAPFMPSSTLPATLAVTTTSGSVALPTGGATEFVQNIGAVATHFRLGGSGVAATSNDLMLQPGSGCALGAGANTYLAAKTDSGATTVAIQSGSGGSPCGGGGGGGGGSGGSGGQVTGSASVPLQQAGAGNGLVVGGAVADGSAPGTYSNPVAGVDGGGLKRTLKTDAQGQLNINVVANAPDTVSNGQAMNASLGSTYTVALGAGQSTLTFQIKGLSASAAVLGVNWTGDNGATWNPLNEINVGGVLGNSISADGAYRLNVAGRQQVQLVVTTGGSGSITVSSSASNGVGPVYGASMRIQDGQSGQTAGVDQSSTGLKVAIVGAAGSPTTPIDLSTPPISNGTDASGTITTGGTPQQIAASSTTRKGCFVHNFPDATSQGISAAENLIVIFGTTKVYLLPGGSVSCSDNLVVDGSAVSVQAATAGHAFSAKFQ